jgi:tRNA nucleotidyltransferase (CCA-adding enzyme)
MTETDGDGSGTADVGDSRSEPDDHGAHDSSDGQDDPDGPDSSGDVDDRLAAVVATVRERVDPDDDERVRLAETAARLTGRVEAAVATLPEPANRAHVEQVGSTARGTWLSGDRDIDLFVRFPTSLSNEELESYGLEVGNAVLPDSREEYAEHPYVTGEEDGFDVDLVPCFDVDSATAIRSSVDRTPFHNTYLRDRLDEELAGEVRAFKAFLKGIGAYGSNLRTRGFSGYLSELLVVEHGGFAPLVEAAADWRPPVEYDPEGHAAASFDDPLVVVDPTDPKRNVAAVCAAENVARLQHYARELLADPRVELFERREPSPLSPAGVRAHLDRRGTTPVAVVFDAPDVVEDQLYPQLRKSLGGVTGELERQGFRVLRSTAFAADRAVLLVELSVAELPAVVRHDGPPVAVREHATGFVETYGTVGAGDGDGGASRTDDRDATDEPDDRDARSSPAQPGDTGDLPDVYGPFLDGDRYVVERDRAFTTAAGFLRSDALFDVALGAHVADALADDRTVLGGDAVATLAGDGAFGVELARYFAPTV